MGELDGKTALVTGASGGIGRRIAERFAQEGAKVALCARNEERLQEVRAGIEAAGGSALVFPVDVAGTDAVSEAVQGAIEALGSLDILVNNAGVTRDTLISRMSEEQWDTVMDINLKGVFNFCRAAARPMMKQRSGCVVNITSIIGLIGNAGQCNYAASKAGIIAFTKSLARELASRNIRANSVAPGFIETEMTDAISDAAREAALQSIPLGKMGATDDIAEAALFLAGDRAKYITGEVLNVSGGLVM